MTWMIEIKTTPAARVDVSGLMPKLSQGITPAELAAQPVWMGNEQFAAGDLFSIRSSSIGNCHSVWSGDLSRIDGIACGLLAPLTILIEGNVGRRLGAGLRGAAILLRGDADDEVGLGMQWGSIQISGNAGHRVGAAAPGEQVGNDRGIIQVGQNCGDDLGTGMRRGAIAVGGNAGDCVGCNMQAGTIAIGGRLGNSFGAGMRRGTIISGQAPDDADVPISFTGPIQIETTIPKMLAKSLRGNRQVLPDTFLVELMEPKIWRLRHGDRLAGARGEFLSPE